MPNGILEDRGDKMAEKKSSSMGAIVCVFGFYWGMAMLVRRLLWVLINWFGKGIFTELLALPCLAAVAS